MSKNMEGGAPEYSATDMKVAEFMCLKPADVLDLGQRARLVPCLAGTKESNLPLLLKEARTALATMQDPVAKQMLEDAIRKYENIK